MGIFTRLHPTTPAPRLWLAGVLALALSPFCTGRAAKPANTEPDLTLRGTVTGKDNHTYRLVPFSVPPGIFRITIDFSYTGREQRTALDLGLFDPHGFRGWGGGKSEVLSVSLTDATPSYLLGAIDPGTWNLLIGIPNIRPNERSEYTAKIYFSRSGNVSAEPRVLSPPLNSNPGWYRGDLHMHTGHSDGTCDSQSGKKVPCPLMLTAQTAARRGLDFIAITDHNSLAHYAEMRELQPYFDRMLLIPGRELTTFTGHANLYGTTEFIDFRVGTKDVPDWNTLLQEVNDSGGLLSINHPSRVTGEDCMGCGFHPAPPADLRRVQAVEAVNGDDVEDKESGIPFWQQQLNEGFRLTAIGGGDNHNALQPLPGPESIGFPTTVVFATELSVPAILQGIRNGHVFIDVTGSVDRFLEFSADSASHHVLMGDSASVPAGQTAALTVHVKNALGGSIRLLMDKEPLLLPGPAQVSQPDYTATFNWPSDGRRHWIRVNVLDAQGKLILLGNPIYFNYGLE